MKLSGTLTYTAITIVIFHVVEAALQLKDGLLMGGTHGVLSHSAGLLCSFSSFVFVHSILLKLCTLPQHGLQNFDSHSG